MGDMLTVPGIAQQSSLLRYLFSQANLSVVVDTNNCRPPNIVLLHHTAAAAATAATAATGPAAKEQRPLVDAHLHRSNTSSSLGREMKTACEAANAGSSSRQRAVGVPPPA